MSHTPAFDFSAFVPGFDFLKNLQNQGTAAAQGVGSGGWMAPTLDPKELDKRIQELKAVQFWLNQNTQAIAASIQALEVQRMTLQTLQDMNLSMGDLAQSLKAKPMFGSTAPHTATGGLSSAGGAAEAPPRPAQAWAAPAAASPADSPADVPADVAAAKQAGEQTATGASTVDPMQWWGALTQQFQHIAQQTISDMHKQAATAPAAAKFKPVGKKAVDKPLPRKHTATKSARPATPANSAITASKAKTKPLGKTGMPATKSTKARRA